MLKLRGCGNHALNRRLKHGGVTSLAISSPDDLGTDYKVLLEFPSLLDVSFKTTVPQSADLGSCIYWLPPQLRKLHIYTRMATELGRQFPIAKSDATAPFGDYDEHVPTVSERFPSLTYLHLEYSNYDISGTARALKSLLQTLPPSLTYLHLELDRSLPLSWLSLLPPQLQELHAPDISISHRSVLTKPLPHLRSAFIMYRILDEGEDDEVEEDEPTRSDSNIPFDAQLPLSFGFPAMQSLQLATYSLDNLNLHEMPSLSSLKLRLASTATVESLFAVLPPTLTALEMTDSTLIMHASDAEIPRLLSLSTLKLGWTNRLELPEGLDDPLSIILAICPHITVLQFMKPLLSTTQGINASIKSLDLPFLKSFSLLGNPHFSQLESVNALSSCRVFFDSMPALSSPFAKLQIGDLRLADDEITNYFSSITASQLNPSAPSPRFPYNWRFKETESLQLTRKFSLEFPNAADPFSSVILHPIPSDVSRNLSATVCIEHLPTFLALLPRTLTRLETNVFLSLRSSTGAELFTPAAFPCLKHLKIPTLMDLSYWDNLDTLNTKWREPETLPPWTELVPLNLTHFSLPANVKGENSLTHLTRLTSVNLQLGLSLRTLPIYILPKTVTAIEGGHADMNFAAYARALPLLKSIDIGESPITAARLDKLYEKHGASFQLIGGSLTEVENIEALLQRVPLPPPVMVNGDVAEFFGQVADAAYPLWKTELLPTWLKFIDFSELPDAWRLFTSWFSPDVTAFDLTQFKLPKGFGASMPSNTLAIIARKERTFLPSFSRQFDFAEESDDSLDDDAESYEEDAKIDEAEDEKVLATEDPFDLTSMPPSLQTLSIECQPLERNCAWEALPNTLTKLLVSLSTDDHFETLIKARLPASLTQLHVLSHGDPNMRVLTHLSPTVERLSLLYAPRENTASDLAKGVDANPFAYLPPTLRRLQLHCLRAIDQASIDLAIARNPNLVVAFTTKTELLEACDTREKYLKTKKVDAQHE